MTNAVALKKIACLEARFAKVGNQRGLMLAKSAREYHEAIVEWRKKSAAAAKPAKDAKAKLGKLMASMPKSASRELEAAKRKTAAEAAKLHRIIKSAERMKNQEHVSQLRFDEKVRLLSAMDVGDDSRARG